MRLEIRCLEGLENDLLLRLERAEIDAALLSLASRERLMTLPGIPRHRPATSAEARDLDACKVPIEDHLRKVRALDEAGHALKRAVAISNRNLGTNHGHLAWQRSETPRVFRIQDDPADYRAYSCFTVWRDGTLSVDDLRFDLTEDRVLDATNGRDLSDDIDWATFGQRVVRDGQVVAIDDVAHEFYDIRHVLAFDPHEPHGRETRDRIYQGYPDRFRASVRRARLEAGVPRARYVHNAVGLSSDALIVVQREGTVEEIGRALTQAGAHDGLILDNGGSVACWVSWANNYAGGIVSPTIDYRPMGTSAVVFLLKGPVHTELAGGSVSPSTY